ncbi:Vacuolar protein-sorting-associated protein 27, partial [Dimargaris xerosporica]
SPPKGRPTTTTTADDGDADLRLAIQLSLQEAQSNPRGYAPPISPKSKAAPQPSALSNRRSKATEAFGASQPRPINEPSGPATVVNQHDDQESLEDDPDLAAAIAASLQEMKMDEARRKGRTSYHSDTPSSAINSSFLSGQALEGTQDESVVPRKPHELSALEAENIELFATLLARIQSDAQAQGRVPNVYQHPQLPYLYGQITRLQPKLTRHLTDVALTHEQLLSLHGKITQAVKKYDAALDQRISQAQGSYPTYAPPGPSTYPSASVASASSATTTTYYAPSPSQAPTYVPPTAGYPEGAAQAPFGAYSSGTPLPPHLAATATMAPGPGNVPPSAVPTASGPPGYPPPAQSPAPANPTSYPLHRQPPPQPLPTMGLYAQPNEAQAPATAPGYGSLSHPPLQPTPAHTSPPANTTTTAEVVEVPLIEL